MTTETVDLTIRKSVTVAAPVERAWEVFTERLQTWWPFDTHSIGADRIEEMSSKAVPADVCSSGSAAAGRRRGPP